MRPDVTKNDYVPGAGRYLPITYRTSTPQYAFGKENRPDPACLTISSSFGHTNIGPGVNICMSIYMYLYINISSHTHISSVY